MKLKDIEVGGRYRAKVSGSLTTVRVLDLKETSTFGGRYRTTIVAVNGAQHPRRRCVRHGPARPTARVRPEECAASARL